MADLPTDPAECAALLRQWAEDETLGGVKFTRFDCARLADMLDRPVPGPAPAPTWDEPEAETPPPAATTRTVCEVCGVIPQDDGPCGFSQCPALME